MFWKIFILVKGKVKVKCDKHFPFQLNFLFLLEIYENLWEMEALKFDSGFWVCKLGKIYYFFILLLTYFSRIYFICSCGIKLQFFDDLKCLSLGKGDYQHYICWNEIHLIFILSKTTDFFSTYNRPLMNWSWRQLNCYKATFNLIKLTLYYVDGSKKV